MVWDSRKIVTMGHPLQYTLLDKKYGTPEMTMCNLPGLMFHVGCPGKRAAAKTYRGWCVLRRFCNSAICKNFLIQLVPRDILVRNGSRRVRLLFVFFLFLIQTSVLSLLEKFQVNEFAKICEGFMIKHWDVVLRF